MSAIPILKIYQDKHVMSERLAANFLSYLELLSRSKEHVYIALSGGNTPVLFFRALLKFKPKIDWSAVSFYWVDERCVAPDHPESNFGVAYKEFIAPLSIPDSSVYRMQGEADPSVEAERYSDLILENVSPEMSFPVFDIIFLGMGNDGHTASVFPNQIDLWQEEKLCTVGTHPETGQKRVTFTGHLINAATRVIFTISGSEKAEIAYKIIKKKENYTDYPASLVQPVNGELEWYLDEDAATFLK